MRQRSAASILLLLTCSMFGQSAGVAKGDASSVPWSPFPLHLPDVAPRPTVPNEMITHLKVAGWPITLEKTKLAAAQRKFGSPLGHSGDAGDSLRWICLYRRGPTAGWILWLTSGEIDGESIGGFTWLRIGPHQKVDSRCKLLGTDDANPDHANPDQADVELPIPLRLDMTRREAESLLGKPSSEFHHTVTYLHQHEGRIHQLPYTWTNSVDILYDGLRIQAIQVDLTISS